MHNSPRSGQAVLAGFLFLVVLATIEHDAHALYQPASGERNEFAINLDEAQRSASDQPLADSALETRFKLIEQGLARFAPAVKPQEALLLLAGLKVRIETLLARGRELPAFGTTEPATLEEFERFFWSMHVFNNQLISAARFLDYSQELRTTARKYQPTKSDATDASVLQIDWDHLKTELASLRDKLTVRDRDLRIARLARADRVLTESKDIAERFLSAFALDLDGEILLQSLSRDATFPASQTKKVKETTTHARNMAGIELLQKARLLSTGLHWWVRGRYGVGTAGGGLVKDAVALKSPEAMFGLLMPIAQPVPTPPTARDPVPLVDRRHHYLWQFETRHIGSSGKEESTTSKTEFVPLSVSITTTSYFY